MLESSIRLQSMLESTKSKSNFQIKTKRFQETSTSVAGSSADDGLIPWTSIVVDHGWAISGHIAGPNASKMRPCHVQRMHTILRTLRDQNLIPDKINNKWFFKNGGEPQKIATKELKKYMDASNHMEYITEFELKNKKKDPEPTFQIFVKTSTGKTITINDVKASDTIGDVRTKLKAKGGGHGDTRLIAGPQLQDDQTLEHYNIEKESTIFEAGRGRGGMQGAGDLMPDIPLPQDTS